MTNRPEPPLRCGGVRPAIIGASGVVGPISNCAQTRVELVRSPGPGGSAHRRGGRRDSREALEAQGALADEQLEPIDGGDRPRSRRLHEVRLGSCVDEINHASVHSCHRPRAERLENTPPSGRVRPTCSGRADRPARRWSPATAPSSCASSGRAPGCDSTPVPRRAPASSSAHTAARALPPAPSTSAVLPAAERQRCDQRRARRCCRRESLRARRTPACWRRRSHRAVSVA